ncbi:ZYRO0G17996p [Zygosaccharomyces rouxii]|uniref:ZYRO0G17996p n=1 Tax=Zygosaccharomyces rouxii (strain ATCC 2623 / CBS 732 / NBRC 1130 / NCYC 568 / NRRL Y-229) TaxID=559307 RepID=C5E146_ZYGRC|nr:uncharacterized protein ZYRO0G17996g [Zygosaccharomyces rouxii]KAH9202823.1 hypothetical protein LQ764DRAFT_54812 [Zygosaccharomyces rouxii]CAR29830.1 ZYRO0G17996p [Zygosaccharomyces rouxii]
MGSYFAIKDQNRSNTHFTTEVIPSIDRFSIRDYISISIMSGSGSIVFRTPLQPDENTFYSQQFRRLDREDLGIVTGESVKPLFAASGLSASSLSQIWAAVDTDNKGFLNHTEFSAALRMISHLQQRPNLPVTPALYETPSGRLPVLGGGNVSGSNTSTPLAAGATMAGNNENAASPVATSPIRATSSNLSAIPLIPHQDVAKFSQLYDRTAMGTPALPGDKAKEIFMKARLPTNTLGEIWALCDRNASGSLSKQEFVMAMYLIQLSMSRHPSVTPLPGSLPNQLWNSINTATTSSNVPNTTVASPSSGTAPISANSTGKPLSRQNTLQRLSSGVFTSASTDWSLGFDKKRQFDAIFDSLDKNHTGSLGAAVLVNFFLSSRLSQETLASVWDLADIHNNAEFTKVEFAIAMFLIQKKNAGVELPDVIPDQLLHSPALGLFPNQQGGIALPPRESKPSFAESQQAPVQVRQNSNNGSLNDLLALNHSFTSPPPPQQPAPRQTSSFSRDSTGGSIPINSYGHAAAAGGGMTRNYTPQADLGQNVIREEAEESSHPYRQQTVQPRNMAPQSPQRGSVSGLPQVGGYGSQSMPTSNVAHGVNAGGLSKNNDLYADAEASAQLSNATTEVANLSNQVNSLTKQAAITSDKKTRAAQELERVNATKTSIESKLQSLRSSHEQNVKEAEELEAKLTEANKETAALEQQLTVTEGNYHAVESKVTELTQTYEEAQQKNHQLKTQISNLNAMSSTLQAQLAEKQRQVKQERSMVDVNSKQMELNQFTVANFENEIQGLGEKLQVYLSKRKELNDYQRTVEQQHGQLQTKYQQLETKNQDLATRGQDLEKRRKALKEQEKAYQQQSAQLQAMFDDLNKKRAAHSKALASGFDSGAGAGAGTRSGTSTGTGVGAGVGAGIAAGLAAGVGGAAAHGVSSANRSPQFNEAVAPGSRNIRADPGVNPGVTPGASGATHEDDVSKFVEATVANSKLGGGEDEDRPESDVFDKDIPTVGSQTEADDEFETRRAQDRTENFTDRFEGDLNEYGIPRTQSLTSSVANNAPQSVVDDVEIPDNFQDNTTTRAIGGERDSAMPGQWGGSAPASGGVPEAPASSHQEYGSSRGSGSIENLTQRGSQDRSATAGEKDLREKYGNIDDEFPPIQELNVNESDTSSDDEVFQDTKEDTGPASNAALQGRSHPNSQVRQAAAPPGESSSRGGETSLQGSQPSLLGDEVYASNGPTPGMYQTGGVGQKGPSTTNSSAFDHRFSSYSPLPSGAAHNSVPAPTGYRDEFDDEFAGLEQANEEAPESPDSIYESKPNEGSMEDFEKIEHKDLDDELNQNVPTGTNTSSSRQPRSPDGISNDEWDEIFAGFGNSKPSSGEGRLDTSAVSGVGHDVGHGAHVESPMPSGNASKKVEPPVNRGIATTPRSLAVEELSGMGFTEQEAVDALERCKWDLEAATNYLLDSA